MPSPSVFAKDIDYTKRPTGTVRYTRIDRTRSMERRTELFAGKLLNFIKSRPRDLRRRPTMQPPIMATIVLPSIVCSSKTSLSVYSPPFQLLVIVSFEYIEISSLKRFRLPAVENLVTTSCGLRSSIKKRYNYLGHDAFRF